MDAKKYVHNKNEIFTDMIPMVYIEEPRLTWDGNDYLDSISNEGIWNQTKETIKTKGFELEEVPFTVIKEFTKQQIKRSIGLE